MYVNTFICLEENVAGYGKNKKHPSGHVTITSPGVVKCYIQDLEKIAKPYIVYLVSKKANKAIRLGQINSPESSKQTVWKIDLDNIQGSNVGAKDIDCIVVVVEGDGIGNTDTVLAGYAKDKYLTTSLIENALPKKAKVEAKPMPKPEVKPEAKPEPKPEVKPEVKPMPKPEVKPEVKPMPKPEVKPMPKPEVKPEIKPMPEPCEDNMPGEGPGPVVVPKEEKCNCGFQMKDGKMEDEVVEKIKSMLNSENARKASKEELEKQILSQVERFLDKDNIADKLGQDFKDLKTQMDTIINLGVSGLDRAEDLMPADENDVEDFWERENSSEDTIEPSNYLVGDEKESEQENAYLKDIEKVLHTIQETMQNEMSQKKKNLNKNR